MGKPEDSLVGRTFEKCRITAKLGTGGMGSVWLAEHFGLGRKVAVKILPAHMGSDPEYVARFMREATTAGRMEHPNIVQIHDVGYADGRHFIVMQYVDGESLSTFVENLGAMEPRDAARMAAGILRGLHHAHEQGIVHRDVKPDNVLITKGDQPMLLDFGLAIETETALQITRDGMVVGTPYYLAPEQARGQKATPLSDLYAAGVTLYYLLTGKRPFVGATALAVLNKHIHEAPVPPVKLKPDIPKALNDIVLKMMAKKPQDRYASAGAAAAELENFLAGRAVDARIPLRMPEFSKKHKLIAAGAGGGLLVLILILALSGGDGPAPPPPVADPDPNPAAAASSPSESPEFLALLNYEQEHRNDHAAYPRILDQYENYIRSTTAPKLLQNAQEARDRFIDFVNQQAQKEFDRVLKVADPFDRLKGLDGYPRALKDLTTIDQRIREERPRVREAIERRYLENEQKLALALEEGKFPQAAAAIEDMRRSATGLRVERLEKLKVDLKRVEAEFNDQALRRAIQAYAPVRAAFEQALLKRDNAGAYTKITTFLRSIADPLVRAEKVNYEAFVHIVPDTLLSDSRLGAVRGSLISAMTRAKDTFPYRILSDLQDALDLEFLIRASGQALKDLSLNPGDVDLATFKGPGRVSLGRKGFEFTPRGGGPREIVIRELHPRDLVLLAAVSERTKFEDVWNNEILSRAAGAAYLYSAIPERWAEASRWFRRADALGVLGIGFRLDSIRERGYREVRERVAKSIAEADQKKFEAARKRLADVEPAWAHDPELKQEIGRAMARILMGELREFDAAREHARMKPLARSLRQSYAGLYDEEMLDRLYAHALRMTGQWQPVSTGLADDTWTWDGRTRGTPAPALDETLGGRGLRLKAGQTLAINPSKLRGATGCSVQVGIAAPHKPFSAGLTIAGSDAAGRRLRFVVQDPGEAVLFQSESGREERLRFAPLEKRLPPGGWVDLAFVFEGGDLACYVDQRPLFILAVPMAPERGLLIACTADTSFRSIQVRK